jgi:two-component system phosphate regulon response regulator PhoB
MAQLLLVESNAMTALALRIHLRRAGHSVTIVDHGDRVAAAVQAARPDLILLDAWLPGSGGCEVARQLKAGPRTRTLPIVMHTVLTDSQWLESVRSCGADAVWTTPTDPAALLRLIAGLLPPAPDWFPADRNQHVRSSA